MHTKAVFFGDLAQGQRKQGQPRKCYKDTLKCRLKWCDIKLSECNIAAQVHPHWCAITHIAGASLERVMSRTVCSPQSSPQRCFCPCNNNGIPVSHLPPTLQIQTGAAEPIQSPLTAKQIKSSLNPRDNHHHVLLIYVL